MKKARLPIERYTARRPIEISDVLVWDEDGEVYGIYPHFVGRELVRDLRILDENQNANWSRVSELGSLLRGRSRRTFMKKILDILAIALGVCVGVFVVIARLHANRLKAIERVTLADVNAMEKLTREEYDTKVGEAESKLMSETVDEVIEGFRERFGVKR